MKTLREYQKRALKKLTITGINILSICPSGGKTFTATEFALNPIFRRVLILAHGTNVLKTQWSEEFDERKIAYSNDINSNERFIITIPQNITHKDIGQFDLLVVDEAHEFYLADKMIKNIIAKAKPKCQLLLTGTPSKFIKEGFKPVIVSGVEVYNEGYLANPYLGCVTSAYSLDAEQFDAHSGDVKNSVHETKKLVKISFEMLIKEMLNRLTDAGMMKDSPNLLSVVNAAGFKKAASFMFGKLEKTMISARNIEQAVMIQDILNKYGVNNLISTSEDDVDSVNVELFKKDPSIQVLTVVRRGILGLNMPELINVVDFTGSRNIDRIYQLYARSLRKYKNKDKFFFKLCYGLNKDVDALFMQAALCLNNYDFISQYNGKNLDNTEILVLSSNNQNSQSFSSTGPSSKKTKKVSMDKNMAFEVLRLGLMSDMVINDQHPHWAEYKWAKFGKVMERLTGEKFTRRIVNITEDNLLWMIENGKVDERIYG
jgi:superfamily II DNA or RNA helicase